MKKIIILFVGLIFTITIFGQRKCSDNNTIWILNDVSGSMKITDPKRNSVEILLALQNHFGNEINSRIINYGNTTQDIYYKYNVTDKDTLQKIVTSKIHRTEQHSDIKSALGYINENANDTENNYIFLITDGNLAKTDIIEDDLKQYTNSLHKIIRNLANRNIPIFTFQTNYCSKNDFIDSLLTVSPNSSYIYIDSREKFKVDSSFNANINNIHINMLNAQKKDIVKISKMLLMTNVLSSNKVNSYKENQYPENNNYLYYQKTKKLIDNALQDNNNFEKSSNNKKSNSNILNKDNIDSIVKLLSLTPDKINKLKSDLLNESNSPLLLYNIPPFPHLPINKVEKIKQFDSFEETAIIGITDYLIDRTEDELFFAYFDNLHNSIFKNTFIKDTLFYNTDKSLRFQHQNSFDLIMLKEAMNKDFDDIYENIVKHPKVRNSDNLILAKYILYLINNLSEGQSFLESLSNLKVNNKEYFSVKNKTSKSKSIDLEKSIFFIADIASHLKNKNIDLLYLKNNAKQEAKYLSIFLFAEFAKEYGIDTLYNVNEMQETIFKITKTFSELETKIENYNKQINLIKTYSKEEKIALTIDILKQILQILDTSNDIRKHFKSLENKNIVQINNIVNNSIDTYFAIKKGEYSKATMLLLPIILDLSEQLIFEKTNKKINKKIEKLDTTFRTTFIQLVNLSGSITNAKTTDDITEIIKTYAMPSRSYRQKRINGVNSLYLNSYVGLNAGYDILGEAFVYGLSAPIGIEYSHGKNQKSIGFGVSLFDFGKPLMYRIGINDKPKLSFQQLFAPGAYISYGFSHKYPISIVAGGNYLTNTWTDTKASFIFSATICVDLPLYRFF